MLSACKLLRTATLLVVSCLALNMVHAQPGPFSDKPPASFKRGMPLAVDDLPPGRLRTQLERLPAPARARALEWLQGFEFPASDVEFLNVDAAGGVLFVDTELPEPVTETSGSDTSEPSGVNAVDNVFALHSKPGVSRVVFLDFDGHIVSGTAWNDSHDPLVAAPFDLDANPNEFSADERARIAEVWHRVAEDLAPFNVDVTTEAPAVMTSTTAHVLITKDVDTQGLSMPYSGAGGVAYVNVFGASNYARYSPAFVYYNNLGSGYAPYVAEAASHEFGHNAGLSHDGGVDQSYYPGHGDGAVSWGAIMGVGYHSNVTQWSRGEYDGATNSQDDIAILTDKLLLRSDDHGDNLGSATSLWIEGDGSISSTNPQTDAFNDRPMNKGIIETQDDVDYFRFDAASGTVNLTVTPAWDAFTRSSRRGANLDVLVQLLDSNGVLVAEADPLDETNASLTVSVETGRYYLAVTGTGNQISPYPEYGSVGQYFISGSIVVPAPDTTPPTPNPLTWALEPAATDVRAITMRATTAFDDSNVVNYRVETCLSGQGCNTTDWQSDPSFTFAGLEGNSLYSFRVQANDSSANAGSWSPSASATTANTPPVANDDAAQTISNSSVDIAVLSNDVDSDGDVLSVSEAGQPANGQAGVANDIVIYTPNTGFVGIDSFTYTIIDPYGGSSSATVSVNVTAPMTPPDAPANVAVTDNTDGSALVEWTDQSDNETGFEVQRESKHHKRNQWNSTTIAGSVSADTTSLLDAPGAGTYRYRVRSVNDSGVSNWTTWVQSTVSSGSDDGGGGGAKCHPKRGC